MPSRLMTAPHISLPNPRLWPVIPEPGPEAVIIAAFRSAWLGNPAHDTSPSASTRTVAGALIARHIAVIADTTAPPIVFVMRSLLKSESLEVIHDAPVTNGAPGAQFQTRRTREIRLIDWTTANGCRRAASGLPRERA